MSTALITGATAGIGAAFARQLAAGGQNLILVARDGARLADQAAGLRHRYGVETEVIAADLCDDDGCTRVAARLGDSRRPVAILVNNAGVGLNHAFANADFTAEEQMLRVNVGAVMRLTHAVLPVMLGRGRGYIINVSSVAGFAAVMPGSTYSASKAWVTNFSESIAASVRPYGVRVMALCPGYTRTEFHQRANINAAVIPAPLWLDADRVVRSGLRDLRRGKVVSIPSARYKIAAGALRLLPRRTLQLLTRDVRGRIRPDRGA